MSELIQLPNNWHKFTISDVATIVTGNTPSTSNTAFYGGKIPFIGPSNLHDRPIQVFEKSLTDYARSVARIVPSETVFVSCIGLLGKTGLALSETAFNQQLNAVVFGNLVDPRFGFYQCQTLRRYLAGVASATTVPIVNKRKFSQAPFVVPPLNEQHRIVAKIEELFSDLDAGVAALERAKANLKRYRAAVLKAAVEGKLTEAQSTHTFSSEKWIEIGTLLTCIEQGWSPKCEQEASTSVEEWAVIKTSAVLPMQFLGHENKRLPSHLEPRIDLEVQENDLLITRAGPRNRAAVTCLIHSCRPKLIVCDKVYRMRCDPSQATAAYLEVVLNSPLIVDKLDELKTGVSDSGVNLTQKRFRELRIPLPSLATQAIIVSEVSEKLSQIAAAEKQIDHGLRRASRLRQSILKQAFEGKLVPQDPADEPAGVLVERIRAYEKHAISSRKVKSKPCRKVSKK